MVCYVKYALLVMVGATFFKVGGAQVQVKKCRKNLWFELATVTSHALKYDATDLFSASISNFMQCFISPLNALHLQCTLSTYATLT